MKFSKKLFAKFAVGLVIGTSLVLPFKSIVMADENEFKDDQSEPNLIYDNLYNDKISNSTSKLKNEDIIFSLLNNTVSYSANSNEYYKGDLYKGSVSISNKDGNVIEIGSTITIMLPVDGIDMESINLTDSVLQEFFNVSLDKETGLLTLILKKQIVGNSNININFSGKIIGEVEQTYNVSINATDVNGNTSEVINNSPSFVVKENTNPPAYGFLNAFWGISPNEFGGFLGKSENDVEGLPTGIFKKNSYLVENFAQINYGGNYSLSETSHYKFAWYIFPSIGKGTTSIDPNDIKVFNDITNNEIPKEWYTVSLDESKPTQEVWVEFKSQKEIEALGGRIDSNISYRVQLQAKVTDELTSYHSTSYNYVISNSGGLIDSTEFKLNNIFSDNGGSELFPTLTVEDKTFYVNELSESNIKEKLLKNIQALDSLDGDISHLVQVDYSKVNSNTIGDYEISYSVTNSQGNTTTKTAIVHIIDRENASPVTVKYVDENGIDIIPPEEINGKVGDKYTTKSKDFDGYVIKEFPENAEGILKDEPQTVVYKYNGQLLFKNAPTKLSFGEHVISGKDESYFIESKTGDLIVQDFRSIGSTWTLSAQLSKDFIGQRTNKMLGSTLSYIDKNGNKNRISVENKTQIASYSTENHLEVNLSSEWEANKSGLELEVPAGKALIDEYEAVIDWTLEDGVPNK
ncbi:DUF5011 domain-containing protein [Enterococcus faecalis]|nr:DUF5011 domain-containing protein [Enterococcus faecalis]